MTRRRANGDGTIPWNLNNDHESICTKDSEKQNLGFVKMEYHIWLSSHWSTLLHNFAIYQAYQKQRGKPYPTGIKTLVFRALILESFSQIVSKFQISSLTKTEFLILWLLTLFMSFVVLTVGRGTLDVPQEHSRLELWSIWEEVIEQVLCYKNHLFQP